MHPYEKYINPYLGKLLKDIKMDKKFVKGEGCYLYDEKGDRYLDCIAAYGALPFGYNPEEIWNSIKDFYSSKEPTFIQPSFMNAAGELAKKLCEITPDGLEYVTFTNSGAETVEAAIKLCRSASGRKGILATFNSFHGKTLGALSATGKTTYQQAFGAPVESFHYIKYGDLDALEKEFENHPDYYAAFIVEPIQGEGGIVEPPQGYLKTAKEICERYSVMLVLDEIQTGLGRTGDMFACNKEKVCPDVLLLAKALGGGLMPIGACVATERVYNQEFASKHSSTFAGNSLACRVALKTLEMMAKDDMHLVKEIQTKGEWLKGQLQILQEKYPNIIASIRGRGLMLGIEFKVSRANFPGGFLGVMGEQELLTPIISSYLLNVEKIRVAPTLNGNNVIRIEPPLIITWEQCQRAVDAIENTIKVLAENNTAKFVAFLVGSERERDFCVAVKKPNKKIKVHTDGDYGRFAFLVHPIDLKNYTEFDKSLCAFTNQELMNLSSRINDMVKPFVVGETVIKSQSGQKAYGEFICIPRTADELLSLPKDQVLAELKSALRIAEERGARLVGLGAFTSVVSMGGLYLKDEGIPLTTGNSYTVVSAVDAIEAAATRLKIAPEHSTAAIIGATGSIGKNVAVLISEMVSRIVLVGNAANKASSFRRMCDVAGEICKYVAILKRDGVQFRPGTVGYRLKEFRDLPSWECSNKEFTSFVKAITNDVNSPISITTSIGEVLPSSDIVVSATSSTGKLIIPELLKYGTIVCDISRPRNIGEDVCKVRPDVLVIDGGVVEVPGRPYLGWDFGFEEGLAYACMSETMMLALEKYYAHMSLGSSGVNLKSILFTRKLAEKHGFKLASLRSFDRPLSDKVWQRLAAERARMKKEACYGPKPASGS